MHRGDRYYEAWLLVIQPARVAFRDGVYDLDAGI